MPRPWSLAAATAAAAAALAAGCLAPPTRTDLDFGTAKRLAAEQQIAYPGAGGEAPVAGIEGEAALGILNRRRASFGHEPARGAPAAPGPATPVPGAAQPKEIELRLPALPAGPETSPER